MRTETASAADSVGAFTFVTFSYLQSAWQDYLTYTIFSLRDGYFKRSQRQAGVAGIERTHPRIAVEIAQTLRGLHLVARHDQFAPLVHLALPPLLDQLVRDARGVEHAILSGNLKPVRRGVVRRVAVPRRRVVEFKHEAPVTSTRDDLSVGESAITSSKP